MRFVRLTEARIDPAAFRFSGEAVGGVATFVGQVRALTGTERTEQIHYRAHEAMALHQMEKIATEAADRWSAQVVLVHRLGVLQPGEVAVFCAAACAHRDAAFEACRFLIEAVKRDVPIWKAE